LKEAPVHPGRVVGLYGRRLLPVVVASILLLQAGALSGSAQDKKDPASGDRSLSPQDKPQDVTDLDIDELVNVRVTSVARKEQTLTDVPAAVTVIRHDDLKRSGATSIAEALRAVPGIEVARPRANSWAVTGRGFNNTSANGLLVLIDGRSVYSPLHSGVFWDVQDLFLEDLDRIEVVRGPGATLWGANAVNGVINVVTKRAEHTQGVVLTGGGGTEERAFGGVRVGFKAADDVFVRTYVKYTSRDDAVTGLDPHKDAFDALWLAKAGFRTDWKASDQDRLTFMADLYDGQSQTSGAAPSLTAPFLTPFRERIDLRGADFVAKWDHTIDARSDLTVQAYYDYSSRRQSIFGYVLHTFDLDSQHRFRIFDDQEVTWGLAYRAYWSDLHETFSISSDANRDFNHVASVFIQDDIPIVKDHLRLTLGSKFEYNSFSHFEVQPSARLAWKPSDVHMVWASVSRAVRTPSTLDQDLRINALVAPGAPPTVLSIFGTPGFNSEELYAFEAGYRIHPMDGLFFDAAIFYNRYNDLRSLETGAVFSESIPPPAHNVSPFFIENELRAQTYGFELASNARLASWWLVQVNYTFLRMNIDPKRSSNDTTSEAGERQNPRNQIWIRSSMDLPANLTLDVMGRYVGRLPAYPVDSYVEMDVRLAWQNDARNIEIAVVGQNLVHESHPEFSAPGQRSEIERGVYGSLTVRF
jgi:iron complex outermembrane recepter protein